MKADSVVSCDNCACPSGEEYGGPRDAWSSLQAHASVQFEGDDEELGEQNRHSESSSFKFQALHEYVSDWCPADFGLRGR